jgi:hypothetical protein
LRVLELQGYLSFSNKSKEANWARDIYLQLWLSAIESFYFIDFILFL